MSRLLKLSLVITLIVATFLSALRYTPQMLADTAGEEPQALNYAAPELVGGPWLNTEKPIRLNDRKGNVTIVHFWTFACINCKHNLPSYARWQKQFSKKGVEIIGVHSPESSYERDLSNVRREVKRQGITYPILTDANGENWTHWRQRYWPAVYLVDKQGRVRYRWEGELGYNGADGEVHMAALVKKLLNES